MTGWYSGYIRLLIKIAGSRVPAAGWLWLLLISCGSWTGYWLLVEQRRGGELLLPLLLSLWLLIWLFIRLTFVFQQPLLPAGSGWRLRLQYYWFNLKFHGTACVILLLLFSSVLISLKLASIVWQSFG